MPPPPAPADGLELVGRLAEEMGRRWRAGERPLAEEFLARHPGLVDDAEVTLELLAEELHLRHECGESSEEARVEGRFPRWRRQVRMLLECHRVLAPTLARPRLPSVGETLGEFRLLAELGRGTHGAAFLATQPELSGRPVVLKIAPGEGEEHLSLARLQHTHIVPLYSAHEFPARGLRALCLPYFGGATLAELLHALRDIPPARRSGRGLRAALCRATADSPVPLSADGPASSFFGRVSYTRAVCWLGTRLADALAYAAERGLLHLDIKPSNVLVAADGQPMLLDFHLARAPLPAGAPAPAWLGGTPGYMAPELRAALAAVREGGRVADAVDGRADVYSLGLLLYEALAGALPPPRGDVAAALRRHNPQVSAGLAAILAKCVAADVARRYATAAAAGEDLRRHLDDLPLRGVANRSPAERWQKWRRRHRLALPAIGLLATLLVTGALSLERSSRQLAGARAALRSGEDLVRRRQYAEAAEVFRRAETLAEGVPFCGDLREGLRRGTRAAEGGLAAGELHRWCERIRPLYGAESLQEQQARTVLTHCRTVWLRRQSVTDRLADGPEADLERQVRADLLDLAILLADLRVRLAPAAEAAAARDEAVAVLDEAERLFGTSCVLSEERRSRDPAGRAGPAPVPRNAWEHLALGRIYLRKGDLAAAEGEMDRALRLEPGALWPNYWKGSCAFRQHRFDDAVVAFSVCVALAPESAWCYANRGLARAESGKLDRAAEDFEHALRLDPGLASAVRGRGLLHYRGRRYPEALADLRRTLELGADPAAAYADMALVHLAAGNRAEALACVRNVLDRDPADARARQLLRRLNGGE
jgi:serine/threonine protein kinase/Tfp pilus assembly protein PilF